MISGTRAVWFGSALFAVVYFALGWNRYATYHSGADLGLFTQTLASAFGGFRNTLEGGNHFTYHFSPVLYLCAPFLIAARSPLALVALQSVAGSLVAPALFGIARRRTDARTALCIAAIAWVYPPLAGVTFTDFHENGFVPAATVWLLWALDGRRLRLASAFAVLLLLIKEDQAPILAAFGIGMALWFARQGERRMAVFGGALALASALAFVSYFAWVRPSAGATTAWAPLHFYELGGVASRGPTTPLFSPGRLSYLLEAFAPLLFVPLSSALVLASLPGFAECLLSHESLTYTMGQHYAAVWIGFVLAAFAVAAPRLGSWARWGPLAASALVLAAASPTHWGHFLGPRTAHHAVLDRFVAAIPSDATVGTHDEIYAHLGFVPGAQIGLARLPRYALFDLTYRSTAWDERVKPEFARLVERHRYRILRSEDGVILAERAAPS